MIDVSILILEMNLLEAVFPMEELPFFVIATSEVCCIDIIIRGNSQWVIIQL